MISSDEKYHYFQMKSQVIDLLKFMGRIFTHNCLEFRKTKYKYYCDSLKLIMMNELEVSIIAAYRMNIHDSAKNRSYFEVCGFEFDPSRFISNKSDCHRGLKTIKLYSENEKAKFDAIHTLPLNPSPLHLPQLFQFFL
jgi:hypothetical protein